MTPRLLSLTHLVREPRTPSAHTPLVLLLHGVGSNEQDLFELAPYLDERFFVVSARAPIILAPGSYAWFHVEFTPNGPIINPADAEASRVQLLKFIDELVAAYSLDTTSPSPYQGEGRGGVYLIGFSQGAIIAQSIALTHPEKIAGVVAMSGRVLPEVLPLTAPSEAFARLPVMVVHGLNDQKLGIAYARNTHEVWSKLPVALTYREYAMGHEVTQESLNDIAVWLKERLDEKSQLPKR